ncbi:tubulin polyglutamylase TTLL11 isoform X1 [Corvus hawaiiensis]|uniref:tubulin polyglutamylase TTLL11 isoform X1 n=1 Tax=Corvus hawaiiensis TaxID=134902 RepID=UPI002018F64C|nr:tubulin polyglutamylase TTLL11 isoform X1 [Corvus hawaiiensis]
MEPAGMEVAGMGRAGTEPTGMGMAAMEPAGLEPAGLGTEGIEPAGTGTAEMGIAGIEQAGTGTAGMGIVGIEPEGMGTAGMEPAGMVPPEMEPAREAEEPPGSPALPAEPAQDGPPAAVPPGQGALPAAPGRERDQERGRRGADAQGSTGRAARGRARRASSRRSGGESARRAGVTVDSSKAKTSLEALKISLRQLRWKEFPLGRRLPCDIYWHGVSFHDNNIFSGQVNKFPGMTETVRKITLSRAMRTMQSLFPVEYDFYPQSWILPEELSLFVEEVRMMKDNDPSWKPTFIVKPDGGCQGDGIYLIKDPGDIRLMGSIQSRPAVVQEYICKPLLMDKLKFDIRLYVLLKSLEPLEIYIAKDGLSRFCTEPYQEPTLKNLHQVFMHLTNYSLNIHSGNFIHSDSVNTGSKRTFSSILCRLSSRGADVKKLWSDIISLVIRTVIALTPELKVYYQSDIPAGKPGPTCFQILGFDILLKKNLKPMLLEVNANPSMRIEHEQELSPGVFENVPSPVDEEVKVAVIRDTLRLVDPQKKKRKDTQCQSLEQAREGSQELPEAALPSLCLKQVFPKYASEFSYLRLVDRVAALFIRFLGVKGTTKLGPTGFRTFIRNCRLSNSNFSMAAADILYIDITRRWNSMGIEKESGNPGMCLQAFVEAFFFLARRKYKSLPLHEQVLALIECCECRLAALRRKRLVWGCGIAERQEALPGTGTAPGPGCTSPPQPRGHQAFRFQKSSQLKVLMCRDRTGS